MGGCQSFIGTQEAVTKSEKDNCQVITEQKLKNNNWTETPPVEVKPYLLDGYISERLRELDMRSLSALPEGFDKSEWIATHTIAFFKCINVFSSALSEFCNTKTCPTTRGPGNVTYYWRDDQGRKVKCSGPLYTDYTMSYIQDLLGDEEVFPTRAGSSFPRGFIFLVQRIFRFLYRILAHLYWAHYRDVVHLEMHPHLNTIFLHLITFSRMFELLDPIETEPLEDLITALYKYNSC